LSLPLYFTSSSRHSATHKLQFSSQWSEATLVVLLFTRGELPSDQVSVALAGLAGHNDDIPEDR
jgi:hypothetical protein